MRWFMGKLPFFDWGSVYCNMSSRLAIFGYIKRPFALFEYKTWFNFLTPPEFRKLIKPLFLSLFSWVPADTTQQVSAFLPSLQILLNCNIHTSSFQKFVIYWFSCECQNVKLTYNLNIHMLHFPHLCCCLYFGHPHDRKFQICSI